MGTSNFLANEIADGIHSLSIKDRRLRFAIRPDGKITPSLLLSIADFVNSNVARVRDKLRFSFFHSTGQI